jgi:GNAT superfamily N-acetyltransferase
VGLRPPPPRLPTVTEVGGVVVRPATSADVPGLVALGEAVWPAAYAFADPSLAQHTIATWWTPEAHERSLRDTTVLVAELDGEMVGMGNLDLRRDPPVIWKLAVDTRVHGRRVGLRLVQALLELAGPRPVRLSYVDGNERAARFYERLGFVPVGSTPPARPGWPGEVVVEIAPDASVRVEGRG